MRRYYVVLLAIILFFASFQMGKKFSENYEYLPVDDILFADKYMIVSSDKLLYTVPTDINIMYASKDMLVTKKGEVHMLYIDAANGKNFALQYAMAYDLTPKIK